MPVGRHQHHHPPGRHSEITRLSGEFDARGAQVVDVELAQLVGRDLADEAGSAAQCGHPGRGVAGRSPADLARGAHVLVQPLGLGGVDQPHRSFGQPLGGEERIVGVGDDVDDRIADRQHVEAVGIHEVSIDKGDRHCEERSDEAIQKPLAGLLRGARND